ncbi:MAG: hypothetical protein ACREPR_21105 [Brasilonema sp.]
MPRSLKKQATTNEAAQTAPTQLEGAAPKTISQKLAENAPGTAKIVQGIGALAKGAATVGGAIANQTKEAIAHQQAQSSGMTKTQPGAISTQQETINYPTGVAALGHMRQVNGGIADIAAFCDPETLLADPELKMDTATRNANLAVIESTSNALDVKIGKVDLQKKALTYVRKRIEVDTETANVSTALTENKNAWARAEHAEFMFERKQNIRGHQRRHTVGVEANWKSRADATIARGGATQNTPSQLDVSEVNHEE